MVYSFVRAFLIASLLPAAALAAPAVPCRTNSTFLGFSVNESGYAESVVVTCAPRRGIEDKFELTRVFDSKTGKLEATFRTGAPRRISADGHLVAVSPATWAANYPAWRAALPQRAWSRLAHAARFTRLQHPFDTDTVRFRAVGQGIAYVRAEGAAVTLQSAQAPLGFVVVARSKDGIEHDVAFVQGRAHEQVRVRFYFSKSGRRIAVHVVRANGATQVFGTRNALSDPLDTPDIGTLNVMQWSADAALRDYKQLGDGQHDAAIDSYIEEAFRI